MDSGTLSLKEIMTIVSWDVVSKEMVKKVPKLLMDHQPVSF